MLTIGVANFNNGRVVRKNMPEIYVAYALPKGEEIRRIAKGSGFSDDLGKRATFLDSAVGYVREHNAFWYACVDETDSVPRFNDKTLAISNLVLESAWEAGNSDGRGLEVIIDGQSFGAGEGTGLWAEQVIRRSFREHNFNPRMNWGVRGKQKRELHPSVYVARRIAYILAAIKNGLPRGEYPVDSRRIELHPEPEGSNAFVEMEKLLEQLQTGANRG